MKKVLIVGTGFLGQKIMAGLPEKSFSVVGADSHAKTDLMLDITDQDNVIQVFDEIKPDVAVLTAGITNVDLCEENPALCRQVNVQGTRNVVEACQRFGAKLVFISSDFVFDGKKGNYMETDLTNPLGEYARSKLEGEQMVSKALEDFLILRTSTLYGFNSETDKMNFAKWTVEQLKNRQKISIVTDQKTNPTLIDDIAAALVSLLEKERKGIYHCTGSEAISRYDFVKKIVEAFSLDGSLVEATDSTKFKQKALRPSDSSLSIAKLEGEGIRMHNCLEGLQEMKRQMEASA